MGSGADAGASKGSIAQAVKLEDSCEATMSSPVGAGSAEVLAAANVVDHWVLLCVARPRESPTTAKLERLADVLWRCLRAYRPVVCQRLLSL